MKQIVLSVCFLLLLTGCADPRVIDDVNMAQAVGYDKIGKEKIEGIFIIPVFKPETKGESLVLRAESKLSGDLLGHASKKSAFPVVVGQLRILLISEEIAKEFGVRDIIDYSYRDPTVGDRVLVAIVKGKVNDLIMTKSPQSNLNIGIYITNMIVQNYVNYNGIPTNLHFYMKDSFQDNGDAFLPYVKKEKDEITVSGVAVLHKNKMVGRVSTNRMFILKTLKEKHKHGIFQFTTNHSKNRDAVIENITGAAKYTFKKEKNSYSMLVKLNVKGEIKKMSQSEGIMTKEMLKHLNKDMEREVNKQAYDILINFQKQGLDPLKLKNKFLAKQTHIRDEEWNNIYPKMKIKVESEAKIIHMGVSR
ncbi:Ger(x)C family spore germination protein [Bacillus massiliigorillae]|uniref:Ger(x)C family spore germination protein n=1 Tax=Bacillus massiliigorillae TaxID=1243664 RepID=UPI0003A45248|nr:Ger(x)C family spore germination protein [Bacillus massiliigorillae]